MKRKKHKPKAHGLEDAQGRDGHGHASNSKETLYLKFII
jgi:hypothetical protein